MSNRIAPNNGFKNTLRISFSILTVTLLSACGGGGSDNNSSNTNTNISTGSGSTPTTSVGTNDSPSLSLNGPNPQVIALGNSFVNQGANANDDVDGDLSSEITESNNVNTSAAGCYKQTYVVSDNSGNANTLTRTILVGTDAERHSPNSAPITQEVAITNSYNSITNINLLNDAFDSDCDALTVTNVSDPAVGTAKINSNGTVTFDPLGYVGSHYFIYTVSDAYGGSSSSGVSIASVDPEDGNDNWPQISGESVTTSKNTAIVIDVLENDFDADGDTLILDAVDTPAHGTIQKQGGKVLYTPDLNYTGEDLFYYGVHDGFGHNGSGLTVITITE